MATIKATIPTKRGKVQTIWKETIMPDYDGKIKIHWLELEDVKGYESEGTLGWRKSLKNVI
jgi:hypothetical protein